MNIDFQSFMNRAGIKSTDELAQKLGVSIILVNKWCNGDMVPTYDQCSHLIELGMTAEELFRY